MYDKQNFFLIEIYIVDPLTYMDDRLFELMKQRFLQYIMMEEKNNMRLIYSEELSSLREGKKDGLYQLGIVIVVKEKPL